MIPLKDDNPTKTFPFITVSIIALNIGVFIYELSLGARLEEEIRILGATPVAITRLENPLVLVTLLTSLFFHGGFAHLLGNMLYLWVFGNNIEDRLGHFRFIFFYLLCGIFASLGHIFIAPHSQIPLIGASGAISGVLAAYLFLYPRARVLVLFPFFYLWRIVKIEAFWFLIFWIGLQFLYGATSYALMDISAKGGIAWFAHIFGFLAGIICLFAFLGKGALKPRS